MDKKERYLVKRKEKKRKRKRIRKRGGEKTKLIIK